MSAASAAAPAAMADRPAGAAAAVLLPDPPTTELTAGEAVGVVAVVAVAAVAATSLALAQLGRHDGWLAVALGAVLAAGLLGAARAFGRRPAIVVDPVEIVLLAATAVAAVVLFFPGFPYAAADKDPGIYVAHGFAIARGGDVDIDDVARERGIDGPHFPGEWTTPDPHAVTSQFYHLPSAFFATADDLGGRRALFDLTPALAVLAVLLITLAARRAAGTWVAAVTAAVLTTSMLQVWQAKTPSSEIPAQLFLAGALLAAVLAVERGWTGGAFVAGLLLGAGFLTRPDGFLYVLLGLGALAVVIAAGRFDRRGVALLAGLAVSLPYAFWNAFVARSDYSASNSVPGPLELTLAGAAIVGLGVLARVAAVRWDRRRQSPDVEDGLEREDRESLDLAGLAQRFQLPIGVAVTLVSGAVLALFWYRGRLFGPGTTLSGFHEGRVPSYDERNLWWLVHYTTRPGIVLMWLGIAVLFLGRSPRSKPAAFLLALPGVLLPLYLYDARISMRLMWWGRRFIPAVLPVVALLTALALGWALRHRQVVLKIAGALATVWLVNALVHQSWPLRDHHEMGGSWEVADGLSEVAGDEQGVFLFTGSTDLVDPMRNSPLVVWWVFDEIAAKLPSGYDMPTIEAYQEAFPGQPVYLVLHEEAIPEGLPADRFVRADALVQTLHMWEESLTVRPDEPLVVRHDLTVWELVEA